MSSSCFLSNNTKTYLETFHLILDDMICGMTGARLSNSIAYNFMVQMIPHHEGAIRMSRNLLRYTTDITLQKIAENIIEEQTKSIQNMKRILCRCRKASDSRQELYSYQSCMEQIMHTMFREMHDACSDNDINADFMREMIPHHEGAIRMSQETLRYNICPELVPILCAIISSQEKGVAEMSNLLEYLKR